MASPKPNQADDTIAKYMEGVVGVVDANSYESLALWREWHKDLGKSWEDSRGGYLVTVGHYMKRPVCLSMFVNVVDGHRILFIEATSAMVDHHLIDKWLKKNLPATAWANRGSGKYVNRVDSMNFHNVFPR